MAGCDYIDNVKGIGILKLISHFDLNRSSASLLALFAKKVGRGPALEFLRSVELAMCAFLYQLVYRASPDGQWRLTHLSDFSKASQAVSGVDIEAFTGHVFANQNQHALGRTDFANSEVPRETGNVDFGKLIRFFAFVPKPSSGFLNNLCSTTATFENFDDILRKEEGEQGVVGSGSKLEGSRSKGRRRV